MGSLCLQFQTVVEKPTDVHRVCYGAGVVLFAVR